MAKPGHRDKACWRARNAIGVGNVLKMNWRKISSEKDHCKVGNLQILPNSFDYDGLGALFWVLVSFIWPLGRLR